MCGGRRVSVGTGLCQGMQDASVPLSAVRVTPSPYGGGEGEGIRKYENKHRSVREWTAKFPRFLKKTMKPCRVTGAPLWSALDLQPPPSALPCSLPAPLYDQVLVGWRGPCSLECSGGIRETGGGSAHRFIPQRVADRGPPTVGPPCPGAHGRVGCCQGPLGWALLRG